MRAPNPPSHLYNHSTALTKHGRRIALLGTSPRRLHFGPGPRTPRMITSTQKMDHRNLSTSPFNSRSLSLITGMVRASGRRSLSYRIPKVSLAKAKIRLQRLSNHENNRHPQRQTPRRRWIHRCTPLLPTSKISSIIPRRTSSSQRRFNPVRRYLSQDTPTRERWLVHYVQTRRNCQTSTVNLGSSFYFRIFRSEQKVRLSPPLKPCPRDSCLPTCSIQGLFASGFG